MAKITREIFDEFIDGWDIKLDSRPPGQMSEEWLEENFEDNVIVELRTVAQSTQFLALLDVSSFALTFLCWGVELGKASARIDAIRDS